jgi:rod shape-determining protein MreB
VEKRLALDFVRPFEKGMLKYMDRQVAGVAKDRVDKHKQAANQLVKHAVTMARPPKGTLVYGVIGAPARASVLNKKSLLEAAKGTFDSVMIVSEPFAVAYGMNSLDDTLVIDIGAGTVDLCRMHGAIPSEEDQITLTTAGDHVDAEFCSRLKQAVPEAQFTVNMAREIKERLGFVHNVNEKAEVTLPVDGKPRKFDVTAPLTEACRSIVPPIVQGLRQLIATFDPEFQQRMLNNILLGGGGSLMKGLDRLLEEALQEYGGGQVRKVMEPVYAGANGALKLSMDMPPEYWESIS